MFNIIEKSEVNNVIGGLLGKGKDKAVTIVEKGRANKGNEKPGKDK